MTLIKTSICSQCGCFSAAHRGHDLKPLTEVYSENLERLKSQVEIVRTRKSELNQLMHDLEQNVEEINRAKGEPVTFFY